jgi:YVTN family beta-propeller protein
VVTRLPAGQTPIRVAFPPKGLIALVSNRDSDDLTVIDLAARQVLKTVPVGRRPGGLTTNQRGTRAYVSNTASGTVSIVALPGYEVTGTIDVGRNPDGITFVPAPVPPTGRPVKRSGSGSGS